MKGTHNLIFRKYLIADGVAPLIQSAQDSLKFNLTEDALKRNLNNRPDKHELIMQNILKSGKTRFIYRFVRSVVAGSTGRFGTSNAN